MGGGTVTIQEPGDTVGYHPREYSRRYQEPEPGLQVEYSVWERGLQVEYSD